MSPAVDAARTEWSQRWLALLDGRRPSLYRLERGRALLRRGDVSDLAITEGGCTARVQTGAKRAVRPRITVPTLDEDTWATVTAGLAAEVRRSADVLRGELPEDLDVVLAAAGASLLPEPEALGVRCNCPDEDLCNHLSALFHATAREIERNPFLLLRMRGRTRDRLVAELRRHRAGDAPDEEDPEVVPLHRLDPGGLDHAAGDLTAIVVHPSRDHDPAALLDRLGVPPGFDGLEPIEELVRTAADTAWRLAAGQGSDAADEEVVLAELRARRMATAAQVADGLGWPQERTTAVLDRLYAAGTVMRTGADDRARYRA